MRKEMTKDENEKLPRKKRFLKIREVAVELNYSERKVWREIESGKLKVHRFGSSTRVSREDLDDYIRRSRE